MISTGYPETTKLLDSALLDRARQHAVRYLEGLRDRHVGARATREELLGALKVPLSESGEDAAAVIDALAAQAERGAIASAGPRYFGFVIGGSIPVSVAADWLTTAWDQNAGIWVTSPLSAAVEEVAREWLLDLLRLPPDASLGFVTGGQMANFTGLAAARNAVLRKAGWNVEEKGLLGAPHVHIVISAEAHITILTSLKMLGFGMSTSLRVKTDGQGRMLPDDLRRVLDPLSGPIIVCTQAGNVNTGSFDPVGDVIAVAHEHGAWVHVDGAFGLWANATKSRRDLLAGVEAADSWATDAHKWLNVPYDSGVAIVRDKQAHFESLTANAEYLEKSAGAARDPEDWTPEFSRRARGFAVYAALRHLGRRGVEDLIERSCAQAKKMASLLARDPRAEVLNDVVLNQVLVRFRPKGGENIDEFTRGVVAGVQREGTCWLAGTTWHGMAAMRISFSNWSTTGEDVERSAEAILRVAYS